MIRRCLPLLVLLAMIASACASSSGGAVDAVASQETDSSAPADATAADGETTPDAGDPDSGALDPSATDSGVENATGPSVGEGGISMATSSPIGAFFDGGFDDAIAEYTMRVEEAIVLCMAAQGFEFAMSDDGRVNEVEQRQNELTTREWTSDYGFGISTSFDSIAQDRTSDPNTAIFVSMSESEREIWVDTLSGGSFEALAGDFNSRPLEDQGCIGQALIETGGAEAIEGISAFGDVYAEGQQALYDQRSMVQAIDAWARCMSESGYPTYSGLDDPESDISDRFDLITDPLDGALENLTDEQGEAIISGESLNLDDLPGLDVDALRALQADERALALADLDCYELHVQAIYEPLRDEFESGLLVEFATEFDALKTIGS